MSSKLKKQNEEYQANDKEDVEMVRRHKILKNKNKLTQKQQKQIKKRRRSRLLKKEQKNTKNKQIILIQFRKMVID